MKENSIGYWTSKTILERLAISAPTLWRLRTREQYPFPEPVYFGAGSFNRWIIEDVLEWEKEEVERGAKIKADKKNKPKKAA